MTETESFDAVPKWPDVVTDADHPFGQITIGAHLCAYCALALTDSRIPICVETQRWSEARGIPFQRTEIRSMEHRALLAAACWPEKFRVVSATGEILDVVAITTIAGTEVCKYHLHSQMRNLR